MVTNELVFVSETCPACGEPIELAIDCSVAEQSYVEDCSVCCRPMVVRVLIGQDGAFTVWLGAEDA